MVLGDWRDFFNLFILFRKSKREKTKSNNVKCLFYYLLYLHSPTQLALNVHMTLWLHMYGNITLHFLFVYLFYCKKDTFLLFNYVFYYRTGFGFLHQSPYQTPSVCKPKSDLIITNINSAFVGDYSWHSNIHRRTLYILWDWLNNYTL